MDVHSASCHVFCICGPSYQNMHISEDRDGGSAVNAGMVVVLSMYTCRDGGAHLYILAQSSVLQDT